MLLAIYGGRKRTTTYGQRLFVHLSIYGKWPQISFYKLIKRFLKIVLFMMVGTIDMVMLAGVIPAAYSFVPPHIHTPHRFATRPISSIIKIPGKDNKMLLLLLLSSCLFVLSFHSYIETLTLSSTAS